MQSIDDGKKFLRANWQKGVSCPCCGQFVKLYSRKLTGAMAFSLVLLYREHHRTNNWTDYIHLANLIERLGYPHQLSNTGDKAKLKYWSLIEDMKGLRPDGSKKIGRYRITQKGIDFVKGRIAIDERVGLYNQRQYRVETRQIYIRNVWDNKFNYDELMNTEPQLKMV